MMAEEDQKFKGFRKWDCISWNRQFLCVDLKVFRQTNYSVSGTCKSDTDGLLIILARCSEMIQGILTSAGVAEFNAFDRGCSPSPKQTILCQKCLSLVLS